jgi:hypothetical protein
VVGWDEVAGRTNHDMTRPLVGQFWRTFREVKTLLSDQRFDIVNSHDRDAHHFAAAYSAVTGRTVIATFHFYARHTWLYL